ncbi:PEPxxWA-CTERM sorting domain-containing protein [Sphingomonas sp. TX0543]|uniref:PEPxxWA-CTERM sorting domain-containing protein n=1 Tax=Sphingomonas sp. TX0543 TaxID=3399682 RepID=UPI003AFA998B
MKIGKMRKLLVILGVLVATGTGTGYVVNGKAGLDSFGKASAAVVNAIADPLSVLSDRSPGDRAAGALTQTKPARERELASSRTRAAPPGSPTERVLTSLRERPLVGEPDAQPIPFNNTAVPDLAPSPTAQVLGPTQTPGGTNILPIPPVNNGGGGGGGGGGIIVTPTPTPTGSPTPPVTPVPEPATWAMLLAGFFGIGIAMRRRVRAAAPLAGG